MADLPTCWYCPEGCGLLGYPFVVKYGTSGEAYHHIDSGIDGMLSHRIEKIPCIPPGTPLPVILDALGIEYREGWLDELVYPKGTWSATGHQDGLPEDTVFVTSTDQKPVLVVPIPATDEAHDG